MIPEKSFTAKMEDRRMIWFETGMIITLLLVLLAFNWKSYQKRDFTINTSIVDQTPEELVQITVQKPPEPPKPKPQPVISTINIVDNNSSADDNAIFNVEDNPNDTIPDYPEPVPLVDEPNVPDDTPVLISQIMPQFPGGESALYEYLAKNTRYPDPAKTIGISGTVYLEFIIEKDGSVSNVTILRGIGGGCDEEAIRVVRNMPHWSPGKQYNYPVRVIFHIGIKFTLNQM